MPCTIQRASPRSTDTIISLRRDLELAGWFEKETRYLFNVLVVPAMIRDKLIQMRKISETEFLDVSPRINAILTRVFLAETRLPALPFGTSLGAVARKLPNV